MEAHAGPPGAEAVGVRESQRGGHHQCLPVASGAHHAPTWPGEVMDTHIHTHTTGTSTGNNIPACSYEGKMPLLCQHVYVRTLRFINLRRYSVHAPFPGHQLMQRCADVLPSLWKHASTNHGLFRAGNRCHVSISTNVRIK